MLKRLILAPTSDFPTLRQRNAVSADKTDLIYQMTQSETACILSRPRWLGTSLLVSTLTAYFEGRRERYTSVESLEICIDDILLQDKVVQIDKYDAPILNMLNQLELLKKFRTMLRSFYGPLKRRIADLRFVFLTGISKFRRFSIFSEINNLTTLTMMDDDAAFCGITKNEPRTEFPEEIQALAGNNSFSQAEVIEALKKEHDGYHFSKKSHDIYNPLRLLSCLKTPSLDNDGYSTGTPT